MYRKKIVGIFWGGVLVVGGIILILGNGFIVGERENQDDTNLEIGLWTPDVKVEQTFIASMDNLSRIDFAIDSYHPWDSPYLDCRLFEIDTEDNPLKLPYDRIVKNSKEVRHKRLNGWLLSPHMFNSFSFLPIPDSKNKRYLFSVQASGVKKGGGSILLASPVDRYLYFGNLFINGEKREGDLAFRALYALPRKQLISQSLKRISLQKPGIFSSTTIYYILVSGYLMMLGGLFYSISNIFKVQQSGKPSGK